MGETSTTDENILSLGGGGSDDVVEGRRKTAGEHQPSGLTCGPLLSIKVFMYVCVCVRAWTSTLGERGPNDGIS